MEPDLLYKIIKDVPSGYLVIRKNDLRWIRTPVLVLWVNGLEFEGEGNLEEAFALFNKSIKES